jgi:hypothetical protein
MRWSCVFVGWLIALTAGCVEAPELDEIESEARLENNRPQSNPLGSSTTFSTEGFVNLDSLFFVELGTNGRHCGHCHTAAEGWTISAAGAHERFRRSGGTDPLFRSNDGATSPHADVSTKQARRAAFRLLTSRGTIRVGIGVPAGAEYELVAIDDPYGYATAAELSLFRRPLPSTNLTLIPNVMWDGRVANVTVHAALLDQANGASIGHAQAPAPIDPDAREAIVGFEMALFNAQARTPAAGRLDDDGAHGSAEHLASQPFEAARFDLFDVWADSCMAARRAIFRGQELFNTKLRPDGKGACRGCHSAANVGTSKNGLFMDIGVSAGARRPPELPLYTFRNLATGELRETTDPGRALITGRWADMDRFKVPQLRALGARAPYFHDGSAATLEDVVRFYETSLGFVFSDDERADLVAFLSAL